jgi:hypothetical protein
VPNHQQTHQAGRHLAAAHALLHGYPATLHGAQTFVDIGDQRAAVMVAGKGAWMIADVDVFTAMTAAVYILVDVTGPDPALYVVPGDQLRNGVRARHGEFMAGVGQRPRNPHSKHTKIEPSNVEQWRDNWSLFGPPPGADR